MCSCRLRCLRRFRSSDPSAGQQAVNGPNAGHQGFLNCAPGSWGPVGTYTIHMSSQPAIAGPSSIGLPNPSQHAAKQVTPHGIRASALRATTVSPACSPSVSSSGMERTCPSRNPNYLHTNIAAYPGSDLAKITNCRSRSSDSTASDNIGYPCRTIAADPPSLRLQIGLQIPAFGFSS